MMKPKLTRLGLAVSPDLVHEGLRRLLQQFNDVVIEWITVLVQPLVSVVRNLRMHRRQSHSVW